MLTKQQIAAEIHAIIENVLQRKIEAKIPLTELLTVAEPVSIDAIQLIKYGIRNYDLITPEAIQRLIKHQVEKSKKIHTHDFKIRQITDKQAIDFATRWQEYRSKLDNIVQQVEYRAAHNYSFNTRLPTQKQLLELEQECIDLSTEWYGVGHGNINLFYLAFVKMCLAANIVRYDYYKINKYVSSDQYVVVRDVNQVRQFSLNYKNNFYQPFIDQGGQWAHGRSEIDATTISNIFYYKQARQLFCLEYAKLIVCAELQLEDYGQLPAEKRSKVWQLIASHFPADTIVDNESIFYKFAKFINTNPGEYFNLFAAELPEARNIPQHQLYEVVKFCGLQCGKLVIVSRTITEDWMPKRYLSLTIQRKYPLIDIDQHGIQHILRKAKAFEHLRIWPNELPYYPEHGLGLCGDGLVEGLENYGTSQYEWNTPFDPSAEFANAPRDIEMLVRQLVLLSPHCKNKSLLPGEQILNVFQSSISYSSIPQTSHVHITRGGIDRYLIYQLPAYASSVVAGVPAKIEFVQVGTLMDAIYLRVIFADLLDELVIQFLQQLHVFLLKRFGGVEKLDATMRLFQQADGGGIFIYEPHVHVIALENLRFLNPENNKISRIRPQWAIPEGGTFLDFSDELSGGLDYARDLFDRICKQDIQQAITDFIASYSVTHQ